MKGKEREFCRARNSAVKLDKGAKGKSGSSRAECHLAHPSLLCSTAPTPFSVMNLILHLNFGFVRFLTPTNMHRVEKCSGTELELSIFVPAVTHKRES